MLLTITYEGENTQELGYLLHKNPERAQQFELSYGKAYVFYPEVSDTRTTAALLLDIDPLDLARGKVGSKDGGLFDYVNDRPYASTSFMSTAIVRIFGTAMSGRCDKRQELADTPLKLTATLSSLKDGGDTELAKELFEPLGYTVETQRSTLDAAFPEWGASPYIDLTISGTVKLSELLNHIYVLIPVFDKQKHYYIAEDEIAKLLGHGEGWLASHPQKEKITRRYFTARKSYARKALDILLADELPDEELTEEVETAEETEARTPLNTQRMETVRDAVLASGASSVIDLGCGECRLTSMLLTEPQIKKVTACDVSVAELEKAAQRLHLDRMQSYRKNKLTLMQASLTYRDKRFEGYDCACVIEVIEHIEPMRIPAFERAVFEFAAPKTVVLTTPNREYNANYAHMEENALRHGDHRFEWTREEFRAWTAHICEKFGYSCELGGIGDVDEALGTPTQIAVFSKAGRADE
ncbi:MAG: 3' terminal RNA ribose 2'-O-methyltransferase Hen1 [Oscillospiraceae bacterium]|nr:3' terminal RNA ribose 2'-O-methyltransferase Hen1 [Oscillospiraceae bacterium]